MQLCIFKRYQQVNKTRLWTIIEPLKKAASPLTQKIDYQNKKS